MNTNLELLGALLINSLDNFDDLPEELRKLIEDASAEVDANLLNDQYQLYCRTGIDGIVINLEE